MRRQWEEGADEGGTTDCNRKRRSGFHLIIYFSIFMTSLVLRDQADTQEITGPTWRDAPPSRDRRRPLTPLDAAGRCS